MACINRAIQTKTRETEPTSTQRMGQLGDEHHIDQAIEELQEGDTAIFFSFAGALGLAVQIESSQVAVRHL